jgi:hypothetical protein
MVDAIMVLPFAFVLLLLLFGAASTHGWALAGARARAPRRPHAERSPKGEHRTGEDVGSAPLPW